MNAHTQMAPVRSRSRNPRAVDMTSVQTEAPHIAALREMLAANEEKNAASRRESAAKKELEKAMSQADITTFTQTVGKDTYDVSFLPGEKDEIDIEKLSKLMDLDKFVSIVSTSQAKVKATAGSNVLASVLNTVKTDAAIKIEKRK